MGGTSGVGNDIFGSTREKKMLPRRIYIPCFVFLLALAVGLGCGKDSDPAVPKPAPESDLTLLALGDSYTVGHSLPAAWCWPYQLADTLAAAGD